eukprot:Opistho-2@55543
MAPSASQASRRKGAARNVQERSSPAAVRNSGTHQRRTSVLPLTVILALTVAIVSAVGVYVYNKENSLGTEDTPGTLTDINRKSASEESTRCASLLGNATLASAKDSAAVRCEVDCRVDPSDFVEGCTPLSTCARVVLDGLVTPPETDILVKIAERGMGFGGGAGGPTIFDLNSGTLSKGRKFVNLYAAHPIHTLFTADELKVYGDVMLRIKAAASREFGLSSDDALHLTGPTFFSRISNGSALTPNDEYWHNHVDKETYGSFAYTSLLYLNDYGADFEGGRFLFSDDPASDSDRNTQKGEVGGPERTLAVEPRKGRVSLFTSGAENVHRVERVTAGTRYALTIAFTCDSTRAILAPSI